MALATSPSFESLTTYSTFQLDTTTGEILVKSALDREIVDSYEFGIVAVNGHLSAEASVVIHVVDSNDHPPKFDKILYK